MADRKFRCLTLRSHTKRGDSKGEVNVEASGG
jgi:hypothetical protein